MVAKISKLEYNKDAREYWKLAKNLQKDLNHSFPSFMTNDDEEVISSKEGIFEHINAYYTSIDKGEDKEAKEFCPDGQKTSEPKTTNDFNTHARTNLEIRNDKSDANDPIEYKEVHRAIWNLKNRKAAGIDGITGECLKHGGQELITWLTNLLNLTC